MESFSLISTSLKRALFLARSRRIMRRNMPEPAAGFTLVEMLVVLAIIAIITIVVLTGQSSFSRTLLLTDTAYTVALSLREAQTYGISSHIFSGNQNAGYGLYLTPNSQSYTEFADIYPGGAGTGSSYCPGHTETDATKPDARPGDCLYESGQDGVVRVYNFGQGYAIGSINALLVGGLVASPAPSAVYITFQRPNTTAVLVGMINGIPTALSKADIYVSAPQGSTQCVSVDNLGQISVQTSCSP